MTGPDEIGRIESLIDLGRCDEARDRVWKALADDPSDLGLVQLDAVASLGLGEATHAVAASRRAVAIAPSDPVGHRLLAASLVELGVAYEAAEPARRAVALEPTDPANLVTLVAVAAAFTKIADEGHRAGEAALRLAPHDPDVHFAIGLLAHHTRRRTEAREAYERTLTLDPLHLGARNNLALLTRRGLVKQAGEYAAILSEDSSFEVARTNIDVLAIRFTRRIYWTSVAAAVALALIAAAPIGYRGLLAAAYVVVVSGCSLHLWSRLPRSVRRYLPGAFRRNPLLALSFVGVLLLFAALIAMSTAPDLEAAMPAVRMAFLFNAAIAWTTFLGR